MFTRPWRVAAAVIPARAGIHSVLNLLFRVIEFVTLVQDKFV